MSPHFSLDSFSSFKSNIGLTFSGWPSNICYWIFMFLFFLLPQNTKVYLRLFTRKKDLVCGQSNSCQVFTIKQGHRGPILIPYDIQGCKSFAEKAAKGLAKKKTHEEAEREA